MKSKMRLKWFVLFSFLFLVIVIVIGYSLLSIHFFIRGMDNMIAGNMAKVVESYDEMPVSRRHRLEHFSGYQISSDWDGMPERVRQVFTEPTQSGVLRVHNDAQWGAPPNEVVFLMRLDLNGHSYFISHILTRATASPLVGRQAARNRQLLLTISLSVAVALAVITWLLLRKIERPVGALGRWARNLNADNLQETPPDFAYPELNELAALIRSSLSSVQASLDREHRFLRHSSHELRTPINIIRNNIELLHKLQENTGNGIHTAESQPHKWSPREKQVIERIDRASLTMKHLTETLLWLSRESDLNLLKTELDMELLVRDLIDEAWYLLKDKDVRVVVETIPHTVAVEEVAARIVVGNLIRNAFQHTWNGTVRINQQAGTIEIVNDISEEDDAQTDIGFGLGLQLVTQLTDRLHWAYHTTVESGRHGAKVSII